MKKKKSKVGLFSKLPLSLAVEHGEHKIFLYEPDELVYQSQVFGKEIKDGELLTNNKKGCLTNIFFDKSKLHAHVHIICTLKDLKKFVAEVEKRNRKLGSCWNNFNPELSFLVQSKAKK